MGLSGNPPPELDPNYFTDNESAVSNTLIKLNTCTVRDKTLGHLILHGILAGKRTGLPNATMGLNSNCRIQRRRGH